MVPLISKAYNAGGTIGGYKVVAAGSDDDTVVQANITTATSYLGVSEIAPATSSSGWAIGQRLNVVMAGIAKVRAGGTIAIGAPVTANADGDIVAAAPAQGVNARCIGFARQSGSSGQIIEVLLAPFIMQGA